MMITIRMGVITLPFTLAAANEVLRRMCANVLLLEEAVRGLQGDALEDGARGGHCSRGGEALCLRDCRLFSGKF